MKTPLLIALLGITGLSALGQSPVDRRTISTRAYRMPANELREGFKKETGGIVKVEPLPPSDASAANQEAALRRNHEAVKEYLDQHGVALPTGSLACYDVVGDTLAVRTTAVVHRVIDAFAKERMNNRPKILPWSLSVIEAPATEVRSLIERANSLSDHSALLTELQAKGKLITQHRGETKSGQRTSATSGAMQSLPVSYAVQADHSLSPNNEATRIGTAFELDPVIGPDGSTLDLTYAISHHYAPPIAHREKVSLSGEVTWQSPPHATVNTSIATFSGQTRLVGTWTLPEAAEPERAVTAMQAAFLCVRATPLIEEPTSRAEEMVKEHGEKAIPSPTPGAPVLAPAAPVGMITRSFKVPPDFLQLGDSQGPNASADPFAPNSDHHVLHRATAKEVLKGYGIPFPEGATVIYGNATTEIVVRNTPANMEMVETFFDTLKTHPPRLVRFTTHVVEAPAALIQRLQAETADLADHRAQCEQLLAQGTVLRSAWIESKSGQRCSFENITSHRYTTDISPEQVNDKAPGPLTVHSETQPVGYRFEIDPVIGPDGYTIDVTLAARHDHAPPEPGPIFHNAEINISTCLHDGQQRILSVWTPSIVAGAKPDVLQALIMRATIHSVGE